MNGFNSKNYISRTKYSKIKSRQKKRIILLCICAAAVITFVTVLFLLPNTNPRVVEGVWVYDQHTKYEFDGSGSGCMCLENLHYEYAYKITNDKLILDFEDDAVHDCTYSFEMDGNTLTLVGGEGTVGGTYRLKKE